MTGLGVLRQKGLGGGSHPTLGAIAHDRPPDLAGGGETYADKGGAVGPVTGLQHHRALGA